MLDTSQTDGAAGTPVALKELGVNEAGHIPLAWLVEDPHNPRQRFNAAQLADLASALKVSGQSDVMQVRLLTDEERMHYGGEARYMIVGGARRKRALAKNGATTALVLVRPHESERQTALDAFVMNESRVGYTDIELMRELKRLERLWGWQTNEEIAAATGIGYAKVCQLLTIHDMAAEAVIDRMHHDLPDKKRLTRAVAVMFTYFDLDQQATLAAELPEESALKQRAWLREKAKEYGVALASRTRNPREQRRLIKTFANTTIRAADELLQQDLSRIKENAKPQELGDLLGLFETVLARLNLVKGKVAETVRVPNASVSPPVLVSSAVRTPVVHAPQRESPAARKGNGYASPPVRSRQSSFVPERRYEPPGKTAQADGANGFGKQREIGCNVYDPHAGRLCFRSLTVAQYKDAATNGWLEYQQKGEARPDWLPDPASL